MRPYITLMPAMAFRKGAYALRGIGAYAASPFLRLSLKQAGIEFSAEEYAGMCIFSSLFYFALTGAAAWFFAGLYGFGSPVLAGLGIGAMFGIFIFFSNIALPRAINNRRVVRAEKSLIPALRDMVVQVNSGIPLFEIMANLSRGKYGAISDVFRKAVKDISAGKPETGVLEAIAESTPSIHFRRVIWQVVNAMKTGAPIAKVLENALGTLYEEQSIQIQKFGSNLGGLAMFYTLVAVIAPAIFLTMSIVVSMFFRMSQPQFVLFFFVMLLAVLFMQVFFLGLIRVRRSALL